MFVAQAAPVSAQVQTPTQIQAETPTQTPIQTSTQTQTAQAVGPVTGFPMPRYVTMRATEGNARRGPSRSHRIDWVFTHRHMPMMVVAEHGHWRRVIDRDGAGGWMHYTLLSGSRSGIVEADMLPLHARPDPTSNVRARVEYGVAGRLDECIPGWCRMEVGGFEGWVDASALWGVEPGEVFD